MKALPRFLWIFLLIGFALRLAAIHARPEGALSLAPDEDEYLMLARNLADGHGFMMHGAITGYRDMFMPLLTALLMLGFGSTPLPMLYVNALLSCATGLLLFYLGKRRFSENTALIMSVVWLLYPGAIIVSSMLFTETLFVFLWTLSLVLHDRLEDTNYHWRDAVGLGVVIGLAMLTRGVGAVLLASYLIYIGLIRFETALKRRWSAAAIMTAACLVVTLPWMIRNYVAVDRFALNTNSGLNLLIGNNEQANGSYKFDDEQEEMLPPPSAGEAARDKAGTRLAFAYMKEHPRETVKLWGKKFAFFWSTDMAQLIHYFWDPHGPPSVALRLHAMPVWLLLIMSVPYMLIVWLGIAGFYLVRHFPTRGILLLQIFLMTVAIFLTYGLPRYRYPLMPLLIIAAGALIGPKVWSSAPQPIRLFLLFTLGMFGGLWMFEFMIVAGI